MAPDIVLGKRKQVVVADHVDIGLDAVQADGFRADHDPKGGGGNTRLRSIDVVGAVPAVEEHLAYAERRLAGVTPSVVDSRSKPLRPVDLLLADIGVQFDLGKKASLGLLETVFGRPAVCLRGVDSRVGQHRLLDSFAKGGGACA